MKKKLIAAALLVMGLAILSAGTIAYFTSQTVAHNVITSGGVTIELQEFADENGTPYPDEPIKVMPGRSVPKIVKVKNQDAEAFVRAQFSIAVFRDGKAVQVPNLTDAITIETGAEWELKDGWYYYNEPLGKDGVTAPLFTEVEFSGPGMTDEYQGCQIDVKVSAQAVQAKNNGSSAKAAQGWPGTETPDVPAE